MSFLPTDSRNRSKMRGTLLYYTQLKLFSRGSIKFCFHRCLCSHVYTSMHFETKGYTWRKKERVRTTGNGSCIKELWFTVGTLVLKVCSLRIPFNSKVAPIFWMFLIVTDRPFITDICFLYFFWKVKTN